VRSEESKSHVSPLTFHVADTGIGIPKDKLQKIFESFSQADKTPTEIWRLRIRIEHHQTIDGMQEGNINVESEEGKGSTFIVSIPFEIGNEKLIEAKQKRLMNQSSADEKCKAASC